METLTIQIPKGEKGETVKAVLKALGVSFGENENGITKKKKKGQPYKPEFVAKIKQGEQDLKEGKGVRVTLDEIWK